MTVAGLLDADQRTLRDLLAGGHPVDVDALAGWQYRGVSLGLPAWIDRLAWKTFAKCFHRDRPGAPVRGWNVRLRQTGLDGALEPLLRKGRPFTFGHFVVVDPAGYRVPRGADRGVLLDYGLGGNPLLDPTSRIRDPVVALRPGSIDLLLGWTYVELRVARVPTPSFFTLERHAPVTEPVPPPRG
jgi:hypothetical protein